MKIQYESKNFRAATLEIISQADSIIAEYTKAKYDLTLDRTRVVEKISTWENAAELINECSNYFKFDPWLDQETYVEVWFEKDALEGVFSRACKKFRVPYLSCRGYCSDSKGSLSITVRSTGVPHSSLRNLFLGIAEIVNVEKVKTDGYQSKVFFAVPKTFRSYYAARIKSPKLSNKLKTINNTVV